MNKLRRLKVYFLKGKELLLWKSAISDAKQKEILSYVTVCLRKIQRFLSCNYPPQLLRVWRLLEGSVYLFILCKKLYGN